MDSGGTILFSNDNLFAKKEVTNDMTQYLKPYLEVALKLKEHNNEILFTCEHGMNSIFISQKKYHFPVIFLFMLSNSTISNKTLLIELLFVIIIFVSSIFGYFVKWKINSIIAQFGGVLWEVKSSIESIDRIT